jgi:hypothetical protein
LQKVKLHFSPLKLKSEHFNAFANSLSESKSFLLSVGVRIKPLKEKDVPFEIRFCRCSLFFIFFQISPVFEFLIILIALVESSRGRAVFIPVSHAHPTKSEFTKLARHMIAALVLFNWLRTFRAGFCVCDNPSHILTLILVLSVPFVNLLTGTRTMGLLPAFEAKLIPASAQDFCSRVTSILSTMIAARLGTPFYSNVVICVRLGEKHFVLLE